MRHLIFIYCALFLLVSCGTQKPQLKKETYIKDSISVEKQTVWKDTTIIVPEDSLRIKVKLKELSVKPIQAVNESGNMAVEISKVNDDLIVDCKFNKLLKKVQLLETTIKQLTSRFEADKETIEVSVRYIPWYAKILAWVGGIVLLIAIIYIGSLIAVKI